MKWVGMAYLSRGRHRAPAPWNFVAEAAGYNLIGEVNDVIAEILFAALIAKGRWLEDE